MTRRLKEISDWWHFFIRFSSTNSNASTLSRMSRQTVQNALPALNFLAGTVRQQIDKKRPNVNSSGTNAKSNEPTQPAARHRSIGGPPFAHAGPRQSRM